MTLTGSWKLVYGTERKFVNGRSNTRSVGYGHVPQRSVYLSDVRQKIDGDARVIENVATMTLSTDPGLSARVSVKGGFDYGDTPNTLESIRMRSVNISKLSGTSEDWLQAFDGTDIFASAYRLDDGPSSTKTFLIGKDVRVSKGDGVGVFVRESSWLDPTGFVVNFLVKLSLLAKRFDDENV